MNDARPVPPSRGNPSACTHPRFRRVGIQRAPVPPFRLYLLTCRECGTTLTTHTLRVRGARTPRGPAPAPSPEDSGTWRIAQTS